MTLRKRPTQKQAEASLKRHNDCCAGCGMPLVAGLWQWDHNQDLQFEGDNEDDNWQPLCTVAPYRCHQKKTKRAATQAAHVRHIRYQNKPKASRPLPGTRASGLRKRMDGTVERW